MIVLTSTWICTVGAEIAEVTHVHIAGYLEPHTILGETLRAICVRAAQVDRLKLRRSSQRTLHIWAANRGSACDILVFKPAFTSSTIEDGSVAEGTMSGAIVHAIPHTTLRNRPYIVVGEVLTATHIETKAVWRCICGRTVISGAFLMVYQAIHSQPIRGFHGGNQEQNLWTAPCSGPEVEPNLHHRPCLLNAVPAIDVYEIRSGEFGREVFEYML